MSLLIHTPGIVIRTIKYGESSIITDILTEKLGLRTYIMSGVTGGNSKNGMFQIMNQLDLVVYHHEHRQMNRIKEAKYHLLYQALPFEINRTAVGIFILELVRKCIKGPEVNEELYFWVKACLDKTDLLERSLIWLPLYFCLGFSHHLGFHPLQNQKETNNFFDLREGRFLEFSPLHPDYLDSETTELLLKLMACADFEALGAVEIGNKSARKKLLHSLLDYYKIHLDHFKGMESIHILEEILNH